MGVLVMEAFHTFPCIVLSLFPVIIVKAKEFSLNENATVVDTIPHWGPEFHVTFSVIVLDWETEKRAVALEGKMDDSDKRAVLRFTSTDDNCCKAGDRIPLFTNVKG